MVYLYLREYLSFYKISVGYELCVCTNTIRSISFIVSRAKWTFYTCFYKCHERDLPINYIILQMRLCQRRRSHFACMFFSGQIHINYYNSLVFSV